MELILLNYENKQTVIFYNIIDNVYGKISSNMRRIGFYDIWEDILFGVVVLNLTIWVFIETKMVKLDDICNIKNEIINQRTFLLIETTSGNSYTISTTLDLEADYVLESDYYVDGTEYNLGLYIEKLKLKKDTKELFIKNVSENGLIIP